jgi:hypothetical protein
VLKHIIHQRIVDHMNGDDLFSKFQFGFSEKRSTTLQLLYCLEDWLELLDEGLAVDNLTPAFWILRRPSTVPHQ